MARSLNRVQLIGNLTRDPELRYTPNGNAVCSFSVATNRTWTTDTGEKKEEADFHRIVAWTKLAEICSQFLTKGRKVYVEGRLSTRNWTAQDGSNRSTTEVVISDMILLDPRRSAEEGGRVQNEPKVQDEASQAQNPNPAKSGKTMAKSSKTDKTNKDQDKDKEEKTQAQDANSEDVAPDDIPF